MPLHMPAPTAASPNRWQEVFEVEGGSAAQPYWPMDDKLILSGGEFPLLAFPSLFSCISSPWFINSTSLRNTAYITMPFSKFLWIALRKKQDCNRT